MAVALLFLIPYGSMAPPYHEGTTSVPTGILVLYLESTIHTKGTLDR